MKFLFKLFIASWFSVASTAVADPSFDLWVAARRGDQKGVYKALGRRGDVNFIGKTGTTPLWEACFFGHDELVRYLLQNGASPLLRPLPLRGIGANYFSNVRPQKWMKNKSYRMSQKFSSLADDLVLPTEVAEVETSESSWQQRSPFELGLPLHVAIRRKDINTIWHLLDMGSSHQIEMQDGDGNTPLHLAIMSGQIEIFEALFHTNAEQTALIYEHLRIARMRSNNEGLLPLHLIALHGGKFSFDMACRLISLGDDMHLPTRDRYNQTAFEIAQDFRSHSLSKEPDQGVFMSSSRLMVLLADRAPDSIGDVTLHLAPSVIAKVRIALSDAILHNMFDRDNLRDPLTVAIEDLSHFYEHGFLKPDSASENTP